MILKNYSYLGRSGNRETTARCWGCIVGEASRGSHHLQRFQGDVWAKSKVFKCVGGNLVKASIRRVLFLSLVSSEQGSRSSSLLEEKSSPRVRLSAQCARRANFQDFFAWNLFFSFGHSDNRCALNNSFQLTVSVVHDIGTLCGMSKFVATSYTPAVTFGGFEYE